jgi:hypothetical protein
MALGQPRVAAQDGLQGLPQIVAGHRQQHGVEVALGVPAAGLQRHGF